VEISEEQREKFLEYVAQGANRQQAAEQTATFFGDPRLTATKFKFLCARDRQFAGAYDVALREGKGELTERLERCAVEMAAGGHWPALKFLLTTYGEQFSWARSSKIEVGGKVEIEAVAGILSRYLPDEMFDKVIDQVETKMLEEQPALPAAAA
jgi:hypothetical protein